MWIKRNFSFRFLGSFFGEMHLLEDKLMLFVVNIFIYCKEQVKSSLYYDLSRQAPLTKIMNFSRFKLKLRIDH